MAKGRDYSLDDQAMMARKEREILAAVVPVYKEFCRARADRDFDHAFLSSDSAADLRFQYRRVSHPGVTLPSRFRYPQDALASTENARAKFMERQFGRAPVGLWPSEGSVSDEALALAAEAGFEWAASDNGVLARTIHQDGGPEVTYRSYLWQQNGRELRMIFRDHFLSDQVGFVYSGMGAEDAAGHFLDRIRENTRPMLERGADVLVPIILDGENAWEYYDHNGRPFLRELYRRISGIVRSGGAHGERGAGSWIRRARWIISIRDRGSTRISTSGSAPKKTIWLGSICCGRGGNSMKWPAPFPKSSASLAYEELLIAEGSDWCWWYGPEHISENRHRVRRTVPAASGERLSRPGPCAARGIVAPDPEARCSEPESAAHASDSSGD